MSKAKSRAIPSQFGSTLTESAKKPKKRWMATTRRAATAD